MVDLTKMQENLIYGKVDEVRDMVKKAIDEGQDVGKILNAWYEECYQDLRG